MFRGVITVSHPLRGRSERAEVSGDVGVRGSHAATEVGPAGQPQVREAGSGLTSAHPRFSASRFPPTGLL